MKSVGEVMAIGRTFQEALQKAHALRWRSIVRAGVDRSDSDRRAAYAPTRSTASATTPRAARRRIFWLARPSGRAPPSTTLHALTAIDPWFLRDLEARARAENAIARARVALDASGAGGA